MMMVMIEMMKIMVKNKKVDSDDEIMVKQKRRR